MKKWFRFNLRSFLLLLTALCIWLGIQVNAARRQHEAVEVILKAGGTVYYDYQFVAGDFSLYQGRTPPGPNWLRQHIGDDYFRTAVYVGFDGGTIAKGNVDQLANLPQLRFLEIVNNPDLDYTVMRQIAKMTKLQLLALNGTSISDAGLAHLKTLEDLERLYLSDTRITDAGLQHLTGLKKLSHLSLGNTQVTDAGVRTLREALPNARIYWP